MDFWTHQEKARRGTKTLVFYFSLAVLLLILAVYVVVALGFPVARQAAGRGRPDANLQIRLWQPELFLWVAGSVSLVVALGSLYKIVELSGGGRKVAVMLGGRPINPVSTDPDERKLLNVIEEMAIASGVPMPEVYLLNDERGINAFAAGTNLDNAAIGVTRGCMCLLNRDELQGVIAHEFSHILNGDMRLNIRLIGVLNGIFCLAIIGRILLHSSSGFRSRENKGVNLLPFLGIALLVLGGIGLLFGKLIKAAVSRQREFLADAAAVQFTRNPDGIGGALKKIGALSTGSALGNSAAEEASHLFFGDGMARRWIGVFGTHPLLQDRIRAIDPNWDGRFPKLDATIRESAATGNPPFPLSARNVPPVVAGLAGDVAPRRIQPAQVIDGIGAPSRVHLEFAENLLAELPGVIRDATHEPCGACALVYGLLLSPDQAMRREQLEILKMRCPAPTLVETRRLSEAVQGLDPRVRLPLVDLALSALRQLSPGQYEEFRSNVRAIIESDRQIDLFEYALERLMVRHLEPTFGKPKRDRVHYYAIAPVLSDCAVVLSGLAHVGGDDPAAVQAAFDSGASRLGAEGRNLRKHEFTEGILSEIDAALDRLTLVAAPIKRQIMDAFAHAVAADNEVRPREAELLRAIADTLSCPIPPFV